MQGKCKLFLEEKFPNVTIREKENQILFNKSDLTSDDLDKLSYIEGMYKSLLIKRSGTGLVIILFF